VDLVRRAFAVMSAGGDPEGMAALAGYWHPDIQYREDPMFPGSSTFHGLDAVTGRFAEYLEVLGSTTIEVESLQAGDDCVLALWSLTGETDRGVPFEQPWAWVVRFRDGLIADIGAFMDREAARTAAGLT
jgi:ketosteroid isomerase-like protein